MEVYGVTGTNGKTTTAYALYSILAGAYGAKACGLMTTVETISAGERRPAARTTPEATAAAAILAERPLQRARWAGMHGLSHGTGIRGVVGRRFPGAPFTNRTRGHLNSHGSLVE